MEYLQINQQTMRVDGICTVYGELPTDAELLLEHWLISAPVHITASNMNEYAYVAETKELKHIGVPPTQSYKWDYISESWKLNLETLAAEVRENRNRLLAMSDWTQLPDSPLTDEKKVEWLTYRQALRDFPEIGDLENQVWPIAPA